MAEYSILRFREVVAHGDRKMPVWGDRYWKNAISDYGPDERNRQRVRTRILELVYYLQLIQEYEY